MQVITIMGLPFRGTAQIASKVASETGYRILGDRKILDQTAEKYGIARHKLEKSLYRGPVFRDRPSRKINRDIAALRVVLSQQLEQAPCVYAGYLGHLIPQNIATRVMIAERRNESSVKLRLNGAERRKLRPVALHINGAERVLPRVDRKDRNIAAWSKYLWDRGLFENTACDVIIPPEGAAGAGAARRILSSHAIKTDRLGERVEGAVADFSAASQIAYAVAQKGHDVTVAVNSMNATLTIHKKCLLLTRLKKKISKIAVGFPGVKNIRIDVGKGYHNADICNAYDYRAPVDVASGHQKDFARVYRKVFRASPVSAQEKPV